jgi:hypothetical protein
MIPDQITAERQQELERARDLLPALPQNIHRVLVSLRFLVDVGQSHVRVLLRRGELNSQLHVKDRLFAPAAVFIAEPHHTGGRGFDRIRYAGLFLNERGNADGIVVRSHRVFQNSQGHGGACILCTGLLEAQTFRQSEIHKLILRQKASEAGVQLAITGKALGRDAQRGFHLLQILHGHIHAHQHCQRHLVLRQK